MRPATRFGTTGCQSSQKDGPYQEHAMELVALTDAAKLDDLFNQTLENASLVSVSEFALLIIGR
eukprot:3934781-Amphidinium_carterae.2